MKDWKSLFYVAGGAASYGVLSTIVKFAYQQGFSTAEVTGAQMFFSAILLSLLVLTLKKGQRLTLKNWILLLIAGVTSGLTGVFYYSALQVIPASLAVVLLFQFTWMGVLVEAVLERKKPSIEKIVSLVFLLLGTLLAGNIFAGELRQLSGMGIFLGLLSACTYTAFILASGRLASEVNPFMRSFVMGLGSLMLVFIFFPPTFLVNGSLLHGLSFWGILLAFFVGLSNLLFTFGVPKIGSGIASILGSIELPMAVFMSWLLLHEQVYLSQWIGIGLLLAGIIFSELRLSKLKVKTEV